MNAPVRYHLLFLLILLQSFSSCTSPPKPAADPEFIHAIGKWDSMRLESLKSPTGWLNLAGLYWLKEGNNSLGSAEHNDLVFPRGPQYLGILRMHEGKVTYIPQEGALVTSGGIPVGETLLQNDKEGKPTLLETDSLGFYLIKRGDRLGIRLRDYKHPSIEALQSIERFPPDTSWIIRARFIPDTLGKTIRIPDVLGDVAEEKIPGILEFAFRGKNYQLYPTGSREKMFLVFGDDTNALETYGAGRFLSVESPDSLNNVRIDFNKAYNPPCAFSEYATCPLPPRENILPFRVPAGEKAVPHFSH